LSREEGGLKRNIKKVDPEECGGPGEEKGTYYIYSSLEGRGARQKMNSVK